VAFYVAGADRNGQIQNLRQHGVSVTATVTGCNGLLGGSGSNAAGFVCKGAFSMRGHRYVETLPGDVFIKPGTAVHAVSVPNDPALVASTSTVASEHVSAKVYILPTIFVVLCLLLGTVTALWLRRSPVQNESA
jgi:hypothetical protein